MTEPGAPGSSGRLSQERRALLMALLGVSLTGPYGDLIGAVAVARAEGNDPKMARPRASDHLVFASGEKAGKVVSLDDLPLGGPPVVAYPMDPQAGVVRDGSRLNQILVIRLRPEELSDETRARAAHGVVAYSAVCTHAGCDLTLWKAETKMVVCPCHESEFDPKASGHVNGGPAPRRLPTLPIKVVNGVVTAAGPFSSRVGFQANP